MRRLDLELARKCDALVCHIGSFSKELAKRGTRALRDLESERHQAKTGRGKPNEQIVEGFGRRNTAFDGTSDAQELAPQYPEVSLDFMYVDNAAMRLVSDPRFFDVFVTENTFGDILTDEASCIPGSMGLLASASLGGKTAVYEPIHGSYPQAAGKGIANPLAAILSAAMMLEYSFGLPREAAAVRSAVESCLEEGTVTEDLSAPGQACSTSEVGERVAQKIASVEIR